MARKKKSEKASERRKQKKREQHKQRRQKAAARASREAPPAWDGGDGPFGFEAGEAGLEEMMALLAEGMGLAASESHPQRTLDASTEGCLPPVFLDSSGGVIQDPRARLGLAPGPCTESDIRGAWRRTLLACPPEQDPEGARLAREARDRLIDPERFLERELGVLHVPSPTAAEAPTSAFLDRGARLAGMAVLYTLVEEELWPEISVLL